MKKLSEENINKIKQNFLDEINKADSLNKLNNIKIKYFSRRGILKSLFEKLPNYDLEERKKYGIILNKLNEELESILKEKINYYLNQTNQKKEYSILEKSLEGVNFCIGKLNPLQIVYNEILEIFLSLGFNIEYGPEIETEDYNFNMLNIPFDHPARDMQDTLYLDVKEKDNKKILLRTHTSPVQVRVMLNKKPPIKSIMPGRVYRHENLDASHLFNFHQVEGLVVDKNIKLSDLKGVLTYFVKSIFNKDIICRFRQSYFPFTEPSLEMDIKCLVCRGEGCNICKMSGFVEVLGCGMVHPEVFNNVGLDYEQYTGFAFGLGVERIAMLKYSIDDIRLFYENDLRFINQF